MKVEHHVTIHSGLNIHVPVFAESREEAERLGREWALAQFAATGINPKRLQLQVQVTTPQPEKLIRAVYASPGDPAEVVMLCRDQLSLERLFHGKIQKHYLPGGLMVLSRKSFEQPFHGPPDRILRITPCLCFHLNDPLIICSCRNNQYSSVPAALEDFLVGILNEAYMQADIVCNPLEKGGDTYGLMPAQTSTQDT